MHLDWLLQLIFPHKINSKSNPYQAETRILIHYSLDERVIHLHDQRIVSWVQFKIIRTLVQYCFGHLLISNFMIIFDSIILQYGVVSDMLNQVHLGNTYFKNNSSIDFRYICVKQLILFQGHHLLADNLWARLQ